MVSKKYIDCEGDFYGFTYGNLSYNNAILEIVIEDDKINLELTLPEQSQALVFKATTNTIVDKMVLNKTSGSDVLSDKIYIQNLHTNYKGDLEGKWKLDNGYKGGFHFTRNRLGDASMQYKGLTLYNKEWSFHCIKLYQNDIAELISLIKQSGNITDFTIKVNDRMMPTDQLFNMDWQDPIKEFSLVIKKNENINIDVSYHKNNLYFTNADNFIVTSSVFKESDFGSAALIVDFLNDRKRSLVLEIYKKYGEWINTILFLLVLLLPLNYPGEDKMGQRARILLSLIFAGYVHMKYHKWLCSSCINLNQKRRNLTDYLVTYSVPLGVILPILYNWKSIAELGKALLTLIKN